MNRIGYLIIWGTKFSGEADLRIAPLLCSFPHGVPPSKIKKK